MWCEMMDLSMLYVGDVGLGIKNELIYLFLLKVKKIIFNFNI